jgi:hypothetical protein
MLSYMKVFKGARKIEREDVIKNKYLMNAYKKDLKNYRIMNLTPQE